MIVLLCRAAGLDHCSPSPLRSLPDRLDHGSNLLETSETGTV